MAQFGRASRSGREGRWFESSQPDQTFSSAYADLLISEGFLKNLSEHMRIISTLSLKVEMERCEGYTHTTVHLLCKFKIGIRYYFLLEVPS